jgi:hypothetical protein
MAANPKPDRRAGLRAVPSDGQVARRDVAEAIRENTAAIRAQTEAIEMLRVALCGTSASQSHLGAIGALATSLEAQRFHRGNGSRL